MSVKVKVGIIGGSGFYKLESLRNRQEVPLETPWGEPSSVPVSGDLGGVEVVVIARHGLSHSIAPGEVNYRCGQMTRHSTNVYLSVKIQTLCRANIWALKQLGVTHVVAATACGSLKEEISPGMFVILDSFVDRTQGRAQSFHGNDGLPGVCHIPMEPAFCPHTRQVVIEECRRLDYPHQDTGTCVTIQGPRFSSKAESLMFRSWGCDVVNMTSVPEVVLAREAGLSYSAIALVTDYDCWKQSHGIVDQASVRKVFADNVSRVKTLIEKVVVKIGNNNWDEVIRDNRKLAEGSVVGGS